MIKYHNSDRSTKQGSASVILVSVLMALGLSMPAAQAEPPRRSDKAPAKVVKASPKVAWKAPAKRKIVVKPQTARPRVAVIAPRRRHVGPVLVYRPYGPTIYGYGFHYTDAEAARWIAFTAITIKLLDMMNEDQVRYHEHAQITATTAPIGEAIVWDTNGAAGSVMPVREGVDAGGNLCREFQHVVMMGGEQETAYGTACQQADGTWQISE